MRREAVDRQAEGPCAAERARDLAEQAYRLGGIERPVGEAIGERPPVGPRADDVQAAVVHAGGEDRQERRADLRPAGRQARDRAAQARVGARGRAHELDRDGRAVGRARLDHEDPRVGRRERGAEDVAGERRARGRGLDRGRSGRERGHPPPSLKNVTDPPLPAAGGGRVAAVAGAAGTGRTAGTV